MSWEVFTKSLEIAREIQIPTLNFFGGEPLLNPLIFKMLRTTLEGGQSLMLVTNCRLLSSEEYLGQFLNFTKAYKDKIIIYAARDRFHLKFFDPSEEIQHLKSEGYNVIVQYYSNYSVTISEYNAHNVELQQLDNRSSCCSFKWSDYIGVLPDGAWTICPPSLEAFGNIFSNNIQQIIEFKRGLPLRYEEGCTECLKDFKGFRKEFETRKNTRIAVNRMFGIGTIDKENVGVRDQLPQFRVP